MMAAASRQHAPFVRFPLGRSRVLGGVLLAGLVLAAAVVLTWWLSPGRAAAARVPLWVATALCLCAGGTAAHYWWQQFRGSLIWDGQAWLLENQELSPKSWALLGSPEVIVDVQAHLWLRVVLPQRQPLWLWLDKNSQPERWMDLRRAVYSRARPGADRAGETARGSEPGRES
jgi:hypothetical protein